MDIDGVWVHVKELTQLYNTPPSDYQPPIGTGEVLIRGLLGPAVCSSHSPARHRP